MGWSQLGVLMLGLCCAAHVVWGQGYVNIAPGKTYNQSGTSSSSTSYLTSNAADGKTGSYFRSDSLNIPFWEVDLGRTYPVHKITVWSLNTISYYLTQFYITVDGQPCVTVDATQIRVMNISVNCSSLLYGQRVRFTRTAGSTSRLYLNEFEILVPWGNSRCDEGRWGPQCRLYCDNNCGGRAGTNFCYRSSLNCYDECVAGRWGERCQKRCGQNCVTGNCDLETGNCSACIAGWYGEQCNKACPSHSCLLNTCHQKTGRCLACHTGYDGENCIGNL
ncbi:uncharacterized protein [Littorina saxatilis]|uniref:uncharacterized protein n=1 Tax=Littorina saxatilis TaxID=31220 RepID=UPI0038B5E3BE